MRYNLSGDQRTLLSARVNSDIDMYLQTRRGGSKVGPSFPPHYAWNNRGGPRPISQRFKYFLQIRTSAFL